MKPKLLVVLGPTATGKSDCAVELARQFNGEIISADSRQVYKGLDIGAGKITKREMKGVPHHMLDIVSPRSIFNVAQFKKKVEKLIADITKRGKLPILCGGTGFYISAIVDGLILPEVKPDKKLRAELEKLGTDKLFYLLKKMNRKRAADIDPFNRPRLIRAIEITKALGSIPKVKKVSNYTTLQIGLDWPDTTLHKRIHDRLLIRFKTGMIAEVKRLHDKDGISWKRLEALGLEYRYIAQFLQNKISREEMIALLQVRIWQFARRQRMWFKHDKTIHWFIPTKKQAIKTLVKKFVKS